MLSTLYIQNFALISRLTIDFASGFSVITGETGAGKSIILGAIGLITGNRADIKQIKPGENKCVVEATFNISNEQQTLFTEIFPDGDWNDNTCVLRREINASGKSRAFINDTPVPLNVMKAIGDQLIDIHSQHQNLLAADDAFQLSVLDIVADNHELLAKYKEHFLEYQSSCRELQDLVAKIEKDRQNEDFMRYQLQELNTIELRDGMQEELEEQSHKMTHAEDIKSALYEISGLITNENHGMTEQLRVAKNTLSHISNVYSSAQSFIERLESCAIELADLASEVDRETSSIEYDPTELEHINTQLDTIYTLQRKYKAETVAELIGKKKTLEHSLSLIDSSDLEIGTLKSKCQAQLETIKTLAAQLTAIRKQTSAKVASTMVQSLSQLGMPDITFNVVINTSDDNLSEKGADKVTFMFSANKGTAPQPVANIASGGEMARVMLSLKALMSGVMHLPTIIFDEIDTGVSGRVAEMMATTMRHMAEANQQVISITHLPQIAAAADMHYKVEKDNSADVTQTSMRLLAPDERITEIAQMLSGSVITNAALQNAKQLLNS